MNLEWTEFGADVKEIFGEQEEDVLVFPKRFRPRPDKEEVLGIKIDEVWGPIELSHLKKLADLVKTPHVMVQSTEGGLHGFAVMSVIAYVLEGNVFGRVDALQKAYVAADDGLKARPKHDWQREDSYFVTCAKCNARWSYAALGADPTMNRGCKE